MIKTNFVLCANRIIRDATDNRISAIDILDSFPAHGFPIVFPRTSMLWVLERDQDDVSQIEGSISVTLGDSLIQTFAIPINFQDQLRTRAILVIAGMSVNGPGRLSFAFHRPGLQAPDAVYSIEITAVAVDTSQIPPGTTGIIF